MLLYKDGFTTPPATLSEAYRITKMITWTAAVDTANILLYKDSVTIPNTAQNQMNYNDELDLIVNWGMQVQSI